MSDRFKWTIVIGLLVGIIVLGGIMIRSQYGRSTAIRSFHACEAAGYPVMETHPRRCNANGQTFTE